MSAEVPGPTLVIDIAAISHNAKALIGWLSPKGIDVIGVTKGTLGSVPIARAMSAAGVIGLGESRVQSIMRLRRGGILEPITLIRSPMLSQVSQVVQHASISLNTEGAVLEALSQAAIDQSTVHSVVLMIELGDLREGIMPRDVHDVVRELLGYRGLSLEGLGTNLACRSGIIPDQANMDKLSRLADAVDKQIGKPVTAVSGGNSANLDWALKSPDVGRINQLRMGESILLGTDPLHGNVIQGLDGSAFTLVGEVIEAKLKPSQPTGSSAHSPGHHQKKSRTVNQVLIAMGRQDCLPEDLQAPEGMSVLAGNSDHLILDAGPHQVSVGDQINFGIGYSSLLAAMTSPFVTKRYVAPEAPIAIIGLHATSVTDITRA